MGDFLEKAKKLGNLTVDKTTDIAEIGKYKAQITSQKAEIKSLEKKLGVSVYEGYKDDLEAVALTEEMRSICQSIDAAYDAIAVLEEKIEKVKDED